MNFRKPPKNLRDSTAKRVSARSRRGSAIAELGPALFILFIVIFFPLLNLLSMALTYADCLWLHGALLREAAISTIIHEDTSTNPPQIISVDLSCSTSSTGSLNTVIANWQNSGLGRFANVVGTPTQKATFVSQEGSATAQYVHVQLNITCRPFLIIPFPAQVPGLNAPMSFQFTGRAVVENVSNF